MDPGKLYFDNRLKDLCAYCGLMPTHGITYHLKSSLTNPTPIIARVESQGVV